MSVPKPNYTQVPNALFVMFQQMPEGAMRCILQIARQTFGFHRDEAICSLDYLQMTTGMSRQGVLNGIAWLMEWELVERQRRGHSFTYRVIVHEVDPSEESTKLTVNSLPSGLNTVNLVDPRKKDLKKPLKKEESGASAPRPDKTLHGKLFMAIADTCLIDVTAKPSAARVGRVAAWLVNKPGIQCDHVTQFGAWFATNDWRGQKGEKPTPEQVQSEWAKFAAGYKPKQGKGRTFQRGQALYTPEMRAAKEREAALALERGEE